MASAYREDSGSDSGADSDSDGFGPAELRSDAALGKALRRLSVGHGRSKAAAAGIAGLALDRIGLRDLAHVDQSFVKLIDAWARRLVALGTVDMEGFQAPPTFGNSPVQQHVTFQLKTWSGKPYVHVPPDAYAFAQLPRDLVSAADAAAGLPLVPGLTVTVVRLVGKLDAPATKSFFVAPDAKKKKSEQSKPFSLVRGSDAARSLVPPAARLLELASAVETNTATIVFPKQALSEGATFGDEAIRAQGGAIAIVFRPAAMAWAVFVDFSPASAAGPRAGPTIVAVRPHEGLPPPPQQRPPQKGPAPGSQTTAASEGSHAFRGFTNVHSDRYHQQPLGVPSAAQTAPAARASEEEAARARLEGLTLGRDKENHSEESATDDDAAAATPELTQPSSLGASVDDPESAAAAPFAVENASLARELAAFMAEERNQMWLRQATSVAMLLVADVCRYDLLGALRDQTLKEQVARVLWIGTVVRLSTQAILGSIGKGAYHDMATASPTTRDFMLKHHTPHAMALAAATFLNAGILLRWANLERCKRLNQQDRSRGVPCAGEVLTRTENAMGKFSSHAFSMEPARALRVVSQNSPTAASKGWRAQQTQRINTLVDDLMGQVYLYVAGAAGDTFAVARPFALLLRAKIMVWISAHSETVAGASPLFAVETAAYLILVLNGCAYEMLRQAGLAREQVNAAIDRADRVDTEAAMVYLNEEIRAALGAALKLRAPRAAAAAAMASVSLTGSGGVDRVSSALAASMETVI